MTSVNLYHLIYIGLFLLLCQPILAGNLTVNPSISLAYQSTDNLTLDDTNETSDNIIEVKPAIELLYESNRVTSNIQYELQSLSYEENSDDDETFQQLTSLIATELVSNTFWVNISKDIDQRSISDTADQQQNNIFANGNIADVSDLIIQPLLRFRNNNINYEIVANFAQQRFDNDDTNIIAQLDSDSESYGFSANSDNNTRFNWGINYFDSQTEFDDDTDNKFSTIEGLVNIAFSTQVLSTVTIGKDDNEFDTLNTDILEDEYWSASIAWTPNNRLNFLISSGQRFDSSDNALTINYQGRKLSITLNRNQELLSNGLNNIDPINNVQPVIIAQNNNVQLQDLSNINLSYDYRRIQLNLSYSHENRESQSLALEETDENISFGLTWQLQSRTNIVVSHNRIDDEIPNLLAPNRIDKLSISTIELNRIISTNSDLSLLARHQKRESTVSTFDYNENGYQINFSHRF